MGAWLGQLLYSYFGVSLKSLLFVSLLVSITSLVISFFLPSGSERYGDPLGPTVVKVNKKNFFSYDFWAVCWITKCLC